MICRLGVCEKETTWLGFEIMMSSHADVVKEIKTAENNLKLRLVTPLDRSMAKSNYKEKVCNYSH